MSHITSGMIAFVATVLLVSSVATKTVPQSRYGGPMKRPPFGSFSRPNNPFPGVLIPSPSHAYSILARPQQQQQPQQQHRPMRPFIQQQQPPNQQPIQFQPPPPPQRPPQIQQYNPTFANNFQQQPQQQQQQVQAVAQQTVYYPQVNYQQHQQTFYKPTQPQQSVSYYQPQQQMATNNHLMSSSSSSNMMNYVPQAATVHSSNRPVHFHPIKQQLDASGSTTINTYEPCTNSHWQPIVSASSSVVPVQSNIAAASGSSATWSRPSGTTSFRYQPESSNKVVVLSHDVLKTLLANSKANQISSRPEVSSGIKGIVDNVAPAASSASATIVTSNGNSLEKGSDQPSVKLVGYIGPTSDNTPTGYIQVPVGKQVLENLSGSNLGSYDFSVNSSQYSLFTMKSVNDVQSLLGVIKSPSSASSSVSSASVILDQDTSASQNIPLGLVVSADPKPIVASSSSSDPIFYPSSSSSGGSNPSIQMVGHVQVTSPDVSSQFTKREGKSDESVAPIVTDAAAAAATATSSSTSAPADSQTSKQ